MTQIKDDKFITDLGKIIANSDINTFDKKIIKAQYDKSYSVVILGVNQDFTDDVTEEEQQALIKKYSIPEVPDKDNYYTFKINGNYYVKSSNTDFKLYEKVVIRVPNGSWDNMYIEVQRDTITEATGGGAKWITSVEEPTTENYTINEGDYWIVIDDEKLRNIIEVRKYVRDDSENLSWNTIDYHANLFKKALGNTTNELNNSAEFIWNNNFCDYGNNLFVGGNNAVVGNYEVITKISRSYVDCEFLSTPDSDFYIVEDTEFRYGHTVYNTNFCKFTFTFNSYLLSLLSVDVNYALIFNHSEIYDTTSPTIVLPFTVEDISEDGILTFNNIRTDIDGYKKGNAVSWDLVKVHDRSVRQANTIIAGFHNVIGGNSLSIGHSNYCTGIGANLIIGERNIGVGRENLSEGMTNDIGDITTRMNPVGKINIGAENIYCRLAIGRNNENAFCAIGSYNKNRQYWSDKSNSSRLYCEHPYMFGKHLTAGSASSVITDSNLEMGYYYGKCNAEPSAMSSGDVVEVFGWGTLAHDGTQTSRNIRQFDTMGNLWVSGKYSSSGADYAEYFEWQDGNINNEDRRGKFVTLDNDKLVLANPDDVYIVGVVSTTPSIVGDAFESEWKNKYKKDIFGKILLDENKNPIISEEYDPEKTYVSRAQRPEYVPVGMYGKLILIDDGTCEVNGYCGVGQNGIGIKCDDMEKVYRGLAFRVIERLDDTHIRIIIK